MLKPKTRWKIAEPREEETATLAAEAGISSLVAQLLLNRNIDTAEKARRFLNIKETSFCDPFLMKGMTEAVGRIRTAVEKEEHILVFGDYDADGVSSTSIMVSVLKEIGARVDYYIPNRFTEGYGPNIPALEEAKRKGFSLVVTVDTGISAVDEADAAKALDLDFIITDHHQPPPVLPDAYCIVNPHQKNCLYPFKGLCGAGVAFKVAHALLGDVPEHLLDLAVLGTIADLVPLVEENRLLAVQGLAALGNSEKPGIQALLKVAGVSGKTITAEDVGFALGPRLNAAGRLDSAEPAVKLLLAEDREEAEEYAEGIDRTNRERQALVRSIADEAIREIEEHFPPDEQHVFVLAKEGWNPGVIGIVASRIVGRYGRPTIILGIDPESGLAKGSARSIDGFNMFQNLSMSSELFEVFGGHPMAAGMTLKAENVDELRLNLNRQAAEQLTAEDFIPANPIDLVCRVDDISLDLIEEIQQLAPFGTGNPTPKVAIEEARLANMKQIGTDRNHWKAVCGGESSQLDIIGFQFGHLIHEIEAKATISVVGQLQINEWNGFRKPQLMLEDLAVHHWQMFDYRSGRDLRERLGSLPEHKRLFISFRNDSFHTDDFAGWAEPAVCVEDGIPDDTGLLEGRYVILADLPHNMGQLEDLFDRGGAPERVYAVFLHDEKHFFSTVPSRDYFKWFYAFLLKRQTFDLETHAESLAEAKGWSKETVIFMAEVFAELDFIKIDHGKVSLSDHPVKRDLSESAIYRKKQQFAQLENDLCYSSLSSLKEWFEKMIGKQRTLEGVVNS